MSETLDINCFDRCWLGLGKYGSILIEFRRKIVDFSWFFDHHTDLALALAVDLDLDLDLVLVLVLVLVPAIVLALSTCTSTSISSSINTSICTEY